MKKYFIVLSFFTAIFFATQESRAQVNVQIGTYYCPENQFSKVYQSYQYIRWADFYEGDAAGYIWGSNNYGYNSDISNFTDSVLTGYVYDVYLGNEVGENELDGYYLGRYILHGNDLGYDGQGVVHLSYYFDVDSDDTDGENIGPCLRIYFPDYDIVGELVSYSFKLIIYRVDNANYEDYIDE